jgi:Ribbon-helix-helix protein, copG family
VNRWRWVDASERRKKHPALEDEVACIRRLAASVESVRLEPEMKRGLLVRAAADEVSVSETIRRALSRDLEAS